jgi:glycosyltransferase involved in cell wall biosynthesis
LDFEEEIIMLTSVSIIIPSRNEEKFIEECLDSIENQDYPKESLEVLIVDGMSEDKTREIVGQYTISHKSFAIRLLDNQKKFTNFAFNIGIKESRGEIIMIMGAHAAYSSDYISKCVEYLENYNADNVGGIIKTLPADDSFSAKAIAACLKSRFGAASSFRVGATEPKWVDTVFGGCYRKEVFEKIGYFNERMRRSQDIEFNKRLVAAGGKILLVPEIVAIYYPQKTLLGFLRHNFIDGVWVAYPLKFGIKYFSLRHILPLFFASSFIIGFILAPFSFWIRFLFDLFFIFYFFVNFIFSLLISFKKGLFLLPFLMSAFFIRHFFYGLGSLWGFIKSKI